MSLIAVEAETMVASFASGIGNFNRQTRYAGGPGVTGQNRADSMIANLRAAAETLLSTSGDEASKGKVDDFLKDLEESVQVASSLKNAVESQKDSERGQKITRLKERIEQLKERLKYATPEQARALAQELKRLGKEFKAAAASLSGGGPTTPDINSASLTQSPTAVPAGGEITSNASVSAVTDVSETPAETSSATALQVEIDIPQPVESGPFGSEGAFEDPGLQNNGDADELSVSQTDDVEASVDDKALGAAIDAYTNAIASAQSQGGYDGKSVKKAQYEELRKIEQDLKNIAARIKALAKRDDKDAEKELKAAEKELRKGSEELDQFQRQQQFATDAAQTTQNTTTASDTTGVGNATATAVSIDAGTSLNLSTPQVSVPANVIV
jgi:Skp family chaperone for outer membrane proteins